MLREGAKIVTAAGEETASLPPPGEERELRLDEAVASYLRAAQAGQPPSREAFLAGYPDLTTELQDFLADEARFTRVAAPLQAVGRAAALPPEGEIIGDYELLELLAQGGMGVVYRARQLSLGRVVALKMLRAGRLAGTEDRQRFRLEAEAVAHLDHPGIVPVYDVGEHDGWLYFSMKFIEGGSLAHRLREFAYTPSAPEGRAEVAARRSRLLGLLAQVADAVHYAHQRGVLHRDLKPGNILLDLAGRPNASDFGLAKCVQGLAGTEDTVLVNPARGPITQSGAILGTPSYMAPEQACGHADAVATTVDVYSLGAIFYELLCGRPPFREGSPLATLRALVEREPVRPRVLQPGIERDLETVCLKCLEKDPARRYGSAHELAEELRRCQRGDAILARPTGSGERLARWCRRNPAIAALAVTLLGSFLLGFALVFWQWQQAEIYRGAAEAAEARAQTLRRISEKDKDNAVAAERLKHEKEKYRIENERARAEAEEAKAKADFLQAHQLIDHLYRQLSQEKLSEPQRKELIERALKYYEQILQSPTKEVLRAPGL
jgi:serine/threonine protein kinase